MCYNYDSFCSELIKWMLAKQFLPPTHARIGLLVDVGKYSCLISLVCCVTY